MKKLFGILFLICVLFLSCNKNRFDYTYLDSVDSKGEWCIPIATVRSTVGDVLNQLDDNDLITYNADGTIQINYAYNLENVLKGSELLEYDNFDYEYQGSFENPYPITIPVAIDTLIHFEQSIELSSETARLNRALIQSGFFSFKLESNVNAAESIVLRSSNIKMADGNDFSMNLTIGDTKTMDLSGVRFETDDANVLNFGYDAHLVMTGFNEPTFDFAAEIHVNDIVIEELSGWVNAFTIPFSFDTTFNFPLNKLEGEMSLINPHLMVMTDNTFSIGARFMIDTAMLYCDEFTTPIFTHYPVVAEAQAASQSIALDETLSLYLNTKMNAVKASGSVILNPDGLNEMVTVTNTSKVDANIEAQLPVSFTTNNVRYYDTIDFDLSGIESPEMISSVELDLGFKSQLPLNLRAKLFAYDSSTGMITDTIFDNPFVIAGSFDGRPVSSEVDLHVTTQKFQSVVNSDKLIMSYALDTDGKEADLNVDDALEVNIKAIIDYDGEIISLDKQ